MQRSVRVQIAVSVVIALFSTGCSQSESLPKRTLKVTTTKVAMHTPIRRYFSHTDKPLGERSAFYPLDMPDDAFASRLFLIDHATTSLDVQYYIYEDDLAGKIFSAHLLKAAQRGVKVRILLDDISTAGKDHALALLAYHPNIELKLFNPNRLRRIFRNFALLLDVGKLGRRMHNKMLVADGTAAIIGGRNIGDVYFSTLQGTLFLDYDILCIGSVVPELYRSFDLYWNATQSVPASEVLSQDDTKSRYEKIVRILDQELEKFDKSEQGRVLRRCAFSVAVSKNRLLFRVADRTDLYYDHPNKIITPETDTTYHISAQIDKSLEKVQKNLIVISPYFIPSDMMLAQIRKMRNSGVKVTVVTNSLASTDVFPVYGGYRESIEPLLKMGVELYELKPHSLERYSKKEKLPKSFRTSLHTKMIIIDDKRLIVGSANLDPRSDKLNTEIVLYVTSETLTRQERSKIESILDLRYFYKLSWEKHPKSRLPYTQTYGPVWTTEENGEIKRYYYPPKASFLKSMGADITSLLPVKGYL